MQKPANGIQKLAWLLIAFGIAAYAVHGVMADDLVMPYKPGGLVRHIRLLHLHGMSAIVGSVCLLLGAAGFVVLFIGTLLVKPGTKPGAAPYLYLAAGLLCVGALFCAVVDAFGPWLIR